MTRSSAIDQPACEQRQPRQANTARPREATLAPTRAIVHGTSASTYRARSAYSAGLNRRSPKVPQPYHSGGYLRAPPWTAVTRSNCDVRGGQLGAALRLTVASRRKATAVLEQAERADGPGNTRLAVRLLNEAWACRRTASRGSASDRDLAALVTITEHDIPDRLLPDGVARDDDRRGPYLWCPPPAPHERGRSAADPADVLLPNSWSRRPAW